LGKEIAKEMLWSETLVGTIFLALTTSLPEFAVSLTAFKFAVDMAIGNILGANFLDIAILPICDIFFLKGQLLGYISIANLITTSLAMILTSIVIVSLIYRSRKSFLGMKPQGFPSVAGMLFKLSLLGLLVSGRI